MIALDRVLDTRPLRGHAGFRRLWIGSTASAFSGQVAVVAVLAQVWELTASPVLVGVVGLATGVPIAVFGTLGGTLADALDRRRLVLFTSAGAAVVAVLLAVQAAVGLRSWLLVLALVAAQTGCSALGSSARRTFVPRLLPRDQVAPGLALNHISFQGAMLVGPALAGLVIAGWGTSAAYALDAAATALSLYGVARLPAMRPDRERTGRGFVEGLRDTVEGWQVLLRTPVLRAALGIDLAQTVLAMPVALFPALNAERFADDPRTLGLFLSAIAAGGIVAALTSGPATRARRPGLVMICAAAVWGVALGVFGLVDGLWAALVCLAVAGAADTVSVISRGTVVQLATPDSHRGRVSAAEYVVGAGAPGIGNARAGLVAGYVGPELAAATGGAACVLCVGLIGAVGRELRRWTVDGRS
ncbi:MFS transporter [Pseudonocardia halophobica]|uniref:MFS transporter n=1 Tax=Pseudonocardia halophobica TaxID=29401 RepID=A0A9W6NXS8_9PSEU|nr:MFS transporter [Pseudonocardia halophobica]GLL13199.1 MFS transporter [Pseudonocardia halophobica]